MTISTSLLLLIVLIGSSHSCDFLDQIQKVDVRGSIDGRGQHRTWKIYSKTASFIRFSECRLGYQLDIPKGAFIDLDTINASLPHHSLFSIHRFDVEATAEKSRSHSVYLVRKKLFRKTFILEDSLSLPIHFRYHAANSGGLPATISFSPPKLLIDCPEDYVVHKLQNCAGHLRILKGTGVPTDGPTWIALTITDGWKSSMTTTMATGDTTYTQFVIIGTILGIFVSLILLFSGSNHVKKE